MTHYGKNAAPKCWEVAVSGATPVRVALPAVLALPPVVAASPLTLCDGGTACGATQPALAVPTANVPALGTYAKRNVDRELQEVRSIRQTMRVAAEEAHNASQPDPAMPPIPTRAVPCAGSAVPPVPAVPPASAFSPPAPAIVFTVAELHALAERSSWGGKDGCLQQRELRKQCLSQKIWSVDLTDNSWD